MLVLIEGLAQQSVVVHVASDGMPAAAAEIRAADARLFRCVLEHSVSAIVKQPVVVAATSVDHINIGNRPPALGRETEFFAGIRLVLEGGRTLGANTCSTHHNSP